MQIPHIPVLLDEVVDIFSGIKEGYIVDFTVGYGGHSEALLMANSDINLICIDQDDEALEFSKKKT
jgi:16S rRNA (cytosine1402-N4)-methyltransferase